MHRREFLAGAGAAALADRSRLAQATDAPAQVSPSRAAGAKAPTPTIEAQMARFAASVKYEELPDAVTQAVKRLLVDTLACGFGGVDAPPAVIAEATFRKTFGEGAGASVIGGAQPLSLEGATLINGILIRYLDLNDVYVGKDPIHPSECIPSALACCEERRLSGKRLIEAIVVGYEPQLALVDAFSFSERGFHSLSCAGYAVPLIAGKLWGLSTEQMMNAIGIAAPRQFCLLAINRGPISMMKALPYGHDAMDSLFATRMAAAGFTGALESIAWFAANVKGKSPDAPFVLEPGTFRINRVGLKRFPLQFELQTVAEAGVTLHAQAQGRLNAITSIDVATFPLTILRTADPSRYRPKTKETADHSLPVCLALALIDGDVTVAQFDSGRWQAPDVLALAQKVKVRESRELMAADPNGGGAAVRVAFNDGRTIEDTVAIADGDPRRPMSRAGLEHKFLQAATPRLGDARAQRVLQLVDQLEQLDDAGALMRAMRRA